MLFELVSAIWLCLPTLFACRYGLRPSCWLRFFFFPLSGLFSCLTVLSLSLCSFFQVFRASSCHCSAPILLLEVNWFFSWPFFVLALLDLLLNLSCLFRFLPGSLLFRWSYEKNRGFLAWECGSLVDGVSVSRCGLWFYVSLVEECMKRKRNQGRSTFCWTRSGWHSFVLYFGLCFLHFLIGFFPFVWQIQQTPVARKRVVSQYGASTISFILASRLLLWWMRSHLFICSLR